MSPETESNLAPALKIRGPGLRIAWVLAAIYLIWGSAYLAIKFAVETIPPFLLMSAQFLTAGSLLFLWERASGAPPPEKAHWKTALLLGILMILLGNGGIAWAQKRVDSGIASLLVSTEPFWIVLLDWTYSRKKAIPWGVFAGLAVGFCGIVLLFAPWKIENGASIHPAGALALLGASFCWASGSVYSRRTAVPGPLALVTSLEMLAGGVFLAVLSGISGEWRELRVHEVSSRSLMALAYLTVFATLIGFNCYIWLLKKTTAAWASTYAYVNPVIALILGWLFAGEPLTPRMVSAAAVILTGVAVITIYSKPPA